MLKYEIKNAVDQLCNSIDKGGRPEKLLAIGFISTDDFQKIGAFLLFEGDLPEDVDVYQKLSPVEWLLSEEEAFYQLNQFIEKNEPALNETRVDYSGKARKFYGLLSEVLTEKNLRKYYGSLDYLTFSGVDPNPIIEKEEKAFVERFNSKEIYNKWCEEFE